MRDGCPFCDFDGPVLFESRSKDVFVVEPLNPVVEGHLLVVPSRHVSDFSVDPALSARVMEVASEVTQERIDDLYPMVGSCNVITSIGVAATQSVKHLHVHVVPRREGDGLALPWTGQAVHTAVHTATTEPVMTREVALGHALDWAEGRRSWNNPMLEMEAGSERRVETILAITQADSAEVVKWSALAAALR